MSHATLAAIIIPVVALIALAAWIRLVYLWRLTGLSAGRGRGRGMSTSSGPAPASPYPVSCHLTRRMTVYSGERAAHAV